MGEGGEGAKAEQRERRLSEGRRGEGSARRRSGAEKGWRGEGAENERRAKLATWGGNVLYIKVRARGSRVEVSRGGTSERFVPKIFHGAGSSQSQSIFRDAET